MNVFYGWDLSTKRSAIVRLREEGPTVEASWTRGPASADISAVLEFMKRKLDNITWSQSDVPFIFVDWSPTEVFAYPKTSKRYLNVKSFLAGWLYNELTSKGAVVSFISPMGVRRGLGLKARAAKESVHHELLYRYNVQVRKFNEHELDAIALAIVGRKIVGKQDGFKTKKPSILLS